LENTMLIEQSTVELDTLAGKMTLFVITPKTPEYPNAKWPGVVVWSEIYNVTGPVLRFANSIAAQGYLVVAPVVFHEFEGSKAIPYDDPGTDAGNSYKIRKTRESYDSDAKVAVDWLAAAKNCTGRIGATGMCLGGHLAFRNALDPRILASVCFFPTDIHIAKLSSTGDDSLARASSGGIKGEIVLIFGVQDGHIPLEGRTLIREKLNGPNGVKKLTFLELQANHAFIRDELSKGRFDSALGKVCFELLLEVFGRTIARDLGEKVEEAAKEEKLVC